jgi:archaellum biogenesis ATPase FlaH
MFEQVIFQNLIRNKLYASTFIPYLKKEYFELAESKVIFETVNEYFIKYNSVPHWNEVLINIGNKKELNEDLFHRTVSFIENVKSEDTYNEEWLCNETKDWVRKKAFELVIVESAERLGSNKPLDDMVQKVQDVFSINFNESIGNNFFRDYERQHDYYTQEREKFESHITELNAVCGGGVERKTLNVLMAPTNGGKTSGLVSLGAGYLKRGYNVLYVTCEMSEENIRQRFDANFLKVDINDVPRMAKESYCGKMEEFASCFNKSNLYVKEYPTATLNVNHLRALLDSLKSREGFVPDVLIIDYLNIMTSVRFTKENSYTICKSIAEEVRGLACQYNLCVWSATQTNRGGDGASDLELSDSSDSFGIPMTVDLEIGIIQTPALLEQGRQIWKALKTRYSKLKGYKFPVDHNFSLCLVTDAVKGDIETSTDGVKDNPKPLKHQFNKEVNNNRFASMGIDFE